MKRIIFIIVFTLYVLTLMLSCTGVKHLTKTIDRAFEKKDSTGKTDSVKVSTDSSKFNSEIVIEYDSARFQEKLMDGSDIDWNPFYPPQEFDSVITRAISKQPVKRITIKTNIQLHKSDSAAYHETAKVKTDTKTVAVNKVVDKKTRSWWWVLLLIIPALYLLYEKYKTKISKWLP